MPYVQVKVSDEEYAVIRAVAAADRRSIASWVRKAIADRCAQDLHRAQDLQRRIRELVQAELPTEEVP